VRIFKSTQLPNPHCSSTQVSNNSTGMYYLGSLKGGGIDSISQKGMLLLLLIEILCGMFGEKPM